jgi:hypothetical protein
MMVAAGALALLLTNAMQAFQILLQIGAGTGLLFILRWFWWRINAICELVAMIVSFVIAVIFQFVDLGLENWQELIIGVGITTISWLITALLTKPAAEETLKSFCKKTHPGGAGWKHVYAAIEAEGGNVEGGAVNLPRGILCMVIGCAMVYSVIFSTGFWLYGQTMPAAILSAVAFVSMTLLIKLWSRK